MRIFFIGQAAGLVLLAAAGAAQAEDAQPAAQPAKEECAAPVAPTGALAPWADPSPLSSAKEPTASAPLHVGHSALLSLHPAGEVRFPVTPGKTGGNGGLAEVTIEEAGNYRVALSTPAWVDLVADGKALTSTAHGHGPKCTSIRKVVDFALTPGRHTVMISANPGPQTQVLVAKLP